MIWELQQFVALQNCKQILLSFWRKFFFTWNQGCVRLGTFRRSVLILDFVQFHLITLIFFYQTECACSVYCCMNVFKCLNVIFKMVASAMSSILWAGILTIGFLQLYLIKLIFLYKIKCTCIILLYICVKYDIIWTYFSVQTWNLGVQNYQSWLLWSQTIP